MGGGARGVPNLSMSLLNSTLIGVKGYWGPEYGGEHTYSITIHKWEFFKNEPWYL